MLLGYGLGFELIPWALLKVLVQGLVLRCMYIYISVPRTWAEFDDLYDNDEWEQAISTPEKLHDVMINRSETKEAEHA